MSPDLPNSLQTPCCKQSDKELCPFALTSTNGSTTAREGRGSARKGKGGVAEKKARVKEAYSQHLHLKAQGHLSLARHAQIPFISVKLNRASSVSAAAAVRINVCALSNFQLCFGIFANGAKSRVGRGSRMAARSRNSGHYSYCPPSLIQQAIRCANALTASLSG